MENREFFDEVYILYERFGPIFEPSEKQEIKDRHNEMVNEMRERFGETVRMMEIK